MIPIQQLKDSSVYQLAKSEGMEEGLEIGLEKGRETLMAILLDVIGKRFPGLDVKAELEFVEDLDTLKQLYFDLDRLTGADALRKRLNELVVKN